MVNILPNAGISPPIPDNFDFQAHLVIPPFLDTTGHSLSIRNAHNCIAETHNEDSMSATANCWNNRAVFPDIGPPLMALYPYSNEELSLLASNPAICERVGPLPTFILMQIERFKLQKDSSRIGTATKETTKLLPVAGSLIHSNPVERVSGQQPRTIIPDVFLYSIRQKFYLPVNWFTHEHLQLAQHRLHDLHTKVHRTEPTSEGSLAEAPKVIVFDMLKMMTLWGNDDDHTCVSPMQWQKCMENYLSALVILSPIPVMQLDLSILPIISYAEEFRKHVDFFKNYPDFEASYPIWYNFERKSRNEILEGTLFSREYYVQNLTILSQIKLLAHSLSLSSSTKRPLEPDSQGRGAMKAPHTISNDSPRSFRAADSSNRSSTPTCLICASSHPLRSHPTTAVAFSDGKPFYSIYQDGELRTAKPSGNSKESKRICIAYNLANGCQYQHEDGRLHTCSLCGREHAALSRSAGCLRVVDGVIRA
ncbi:hypothetical protein EV368DRAFT_60860 [Lentinula lateritia]|nr:hypothetical protein EV368DRAFT_60860 [Lentinula lateritia]